MAKIVYVDDNTMSIDVLKRQLKDYGVEVIGATNGMEALQVIQAIQPNVVLLDVRLPDIDGIEVMVRLRENPSIAHIPVIMFTGHISSRTRRYAERMGANDYLIKPANTPLLLETLRRYVQVDLLPA